MTTWFRFLLRTGCTEEIKGLCIALYYSIDEYLDELDVILRKATALFLEHLPDMSAVCHQVMQEAQQKAGDNPSSCLAFWILRIHPPV